MTHTRRPPLTLPATLAPLIVKRCPSCGCTYARRDDKPRCGVCEAQPVERPP